VKLQSSFDAEMRWCFEKINFAQRQGAVGTFQRQRLFDGSRRSGTFASLRDGSLTRWTWTGSPLVKAMLVRRKASALAPEWTNSQLLITEPRSRRWISVGALPTCSMTLCEASGQGQGADGKKPESTSAATSSNAVDNLPRSRGRPRIMRGR